jgi:hypothetical protein
VSRHSACRRKVHYTSSWGAFQAQSALVRDGARNLTVYKCVCGWWCVGHKPGAPVIKATAFTQGVPS